MSIKPVLLRDQALSLIRERILQGSLAPGQRVVESSLARELGVSQAPVREALQRLALEGLVEIYDHKGAVVTEVSLSEMRELFELRKVIEGRAVANSLRVIGKAHLKVLEGLLKEMLEAAKAKDLQGLVDADLRFHRTVVEWSGHAVLLKMWNVADVQVRRFIYTTHPKYFRDYREIAETHRPLIAALASGREKTAVSSFQSHLKMIWDLIGKDANLSEAR